ncbi:hypothetical protein [Paenibacillus sp. FSL M7-0896]
MKNWVQLSIALVNLATAVTLDEATKETSKVEETKEKGTKRSKRK